MIDQHARERMNAPFVNPSYVEALEAVLDRTENLRESGRDGDYLRGQLELIADLWGIKGVFTSERIDQIEHDLKTLITANES